MNLKSKLKKTLLAVVTPAILVGVALSGNALALDATQGDLVLAIYGNNTEFYENLGNANTLVSTGGTFTIDSTTLTAVGGANPVKWTLVGYDIDPGTGNPTLFAGSSKAPNQYTPSQQGAVNVPNSANTTFNWEAQLSDSLSQQTLSSADSKAFTNSSNGFGTTGTLAGGFPVAMEAAFGSSLSIIQGDYATNALTQLGTASFSLSGSTLTIGIQAVPIPAALVLFGTGLVGLVGVARRKLIMT